MLGYFPPRPWLLIPEEGPSDPALTRELSSSRSTSNWEAYFESQPGWRGGRQRRSDEKWWRRNTDHHTGGDFRWCRCRAPLPSKTQIRHPQRRSCVAGRVWEHWPEPPPRQSSEESDKISIIIVARLKTNTPKPDREPCPWNDCHPRRKWTSCSSPRNNDQTDGRNIPLSSGTSQSAPGEIRSLNITIQT